MQTIIIVEETAEMHVFDGDLKEACRQAFADKIFHWAESAEDIQEAIENDGWLVSYEIGKIISHIF